MGQMIFRRWALATLALIVVAAAATVAIPRLVNAQALDIEISPVKESLTLDPGTTSVQTIRVRNGTDSDQTFFFNKEDFTIGDNQGNVEFFEPGIDRDRTHSLEDWLSFEGESIVVPAQDETSFDVFIDVPRDAEPGGHYAAVFVQTSPPVLEDGEASSVSTVGRIGSLLLVTVPGDVNEGLELVNFAAEQTDNDEGGSVIQFLTTLRNTGNVHVEPAGQISFSGVGVSNEPIQFNDGQSSVLPGTPERVFEDEIQLESSGLIPPIGRVTAELTLTYGENGETLTMQTSIMVWPLGFIGVAVGILLVGLFVAWRIFLSFRPTSKRVRL